MLASQRLPWPLIAVVTSLLECSFRVRLPSRKCEHVLGYEPETRLSSLGQQSSVSCCAIYPAARLPARKLSRRNENGFVSRFWSVPSCASIAFEDSQHRTKRQQVAVAVERRGRTSSKPRLRLKLGGRPHMPLARRRFSRVTCVAKVSACLWNIVSSHTPLGSSRRRM
jgi:hypothetical protein